MSCQMCRERGKTWEGADPQCAFEGGKFSRENWNCATANAIRDICEPFNTLVTDGVTHTYCDDQHYGTIRVYDLFDGDSVEYQQADGPMPLALWVTWYKNRGRTESMWVLGDDGDPRRPTEAECRRIIEVYGKP